MEGFPYKPSCLPLVVPKVLAVKLVFCQGLICSAPVQRWASMCARTKKHLEIKGRCLLLFARAENVGLLEPGALPRDQSARLVSSFQNLLPSSLEFWPNSPRVGNKNPSSLQKFRKRVHL